MANPTGSMSKKQFGEKLRSLIVKKGWNQSELARRASVFLDKEMGRDNVSVYVNGKSLPGNTHLYALARALEIEPAELLPNIAGSTNTGSTLKVTSIPGRPKVARLRVDQEVPFDQAVKIIQILNADNADC